MTLPYRGVTFISWRNKVWSDSMKHTGGILWINHISTGVLWQGDGLFNLLIDISLELTYKADHKVGQTTTWYDIVVISPIHWDRKCFWYQNDQTMTKRSCNWLSMQRRQNTCLWEIHQRLVTEKQRITDYFEVVEQVCYLGTVVASNKISI